MNVAFTHLNTVWKRCELLDLAPLFFVGFIPLFFKAWKSASIKYVLWYKKCVLNFKCMITKLNLLGEESFSFRFSPFEDSKTHNRSAKFQTFGAFPMLWFTKRGEIFYTHHFLLEKSCRIDRITSYEQEIQWKRTSE